MSKLYLKDAPPSLSRCAHTAMKRRLRCKAIEAEAEVAAGPGVGRSDKLHSRVCASWSLSFDIVHRLIIVKRYIWNEADVAEAWPSTQGAALGTSFQYIEP